MSRVGPQGGERVWELQKATQEDTDALTRRSSPADTGTRVYPVSYLYLPRYQTNIGMKRHPATDTGIQMALEWTSV
jgi:hypothetical protein